MSSIHSRWQMLGLHHEAKGWIDNHLPKGLSAPFPFSPSLQLQWCANVRAALRALNANDTARFSLLMNEAWERASASYQREVVAPSWQRALIAADYILEHHVDSLGDGINKTAFRRLGGIAFAENSESLTLDERFREIVRVLDDDASAVNQKQFLNVLDALERALLLYDPMPHRSRSRILAQPHG